MSSADPEAYAKLPETSETQEEGTDQETPTPPGTSDAGMLVVEPVPAPEPTCWATIRKHANRRNILRLSLLALAGIAVLTVIILLVKFGIWEMILQGIHSLGPWGVFILSVAVFVSAIPPIPGYAIFLVGSGFLYGWLGLIPVSISALAGAVSVFVVARRWARPCLERQMADNKNVALFDEAIHTNAFKFVVLLRVTPIPFNWTSLLLAATKITAGPYALGSALGALVQQVLLVYVGTTLSDLSQVNEIEWTPARIALLVVQGVAIVTAVVLIALYARRTYRAMMAAAAARHQAHADTLADPSA